MEYASILVDAALAEDIGEGDITTRAIVKKGQEGKAEFIAKEDMTVAGLFIAELAFIRLDKKAVFKARYKDGDKIKKGEVMATVSGGLGTLLTGERVALNFLQRLSGIATKTSAFVKAMKSPKTLLLDTRKTTPCLRPLEKYAVVAGGGTNHRLGLYDSILIKDNHIMAAGSVTAAIDAVRKKYKDTVQIEVEVTDLSETKEAVSCGADMIMLDNMKVPVMKKAMLLIGDTVLVEASGNIDINNIAAVAATGVDFISVGALTHSAKSIDISMEVVWAKKSKKSK
ncbi:MAG: nicotinate-nucleotide diphosphorylase (carboxylating) [Deltaproteobacteria bacterium GWA2_54_12]|nr:MAG: nicotinate-nucleotide diphosphorylase (carboxylating) [Deltaproteobacteria bacterium GWA2_54_12]